MVMFPLSALETVACGISDSEHDEKVVVISVQVVSAVPSPGPVGRPVTLASVPGAPFVFSGKEVYSSSQVVSGAPLPAGRVWVPVTAGIEELVHLGEVCDWGTLVPVPIPLDQGLEMVPGCPVVEDPEAREEDERVPVSTEEPLSSDPVGDTTGPEEVAEPLTPVSQESVDAGCVALGHGPVLPCPDDVADMGREKVLPLLVQAVQSAV